jgi:4-hydroxythreonine-4-phosphate dehydrogenase
MHQDEKNGMEMASSQDRPRIALVMGDPCGISPELMAKLLALPETTVRAAIVVIGDRRVLAAGEAVAGTKLDLAEVSRIEDARLARGAATFLDLHHLDPQTVERGKASAQGGAFALANYRRGLQLAKDGVVDCLCFTPFNKQALHMAGNKFEDEMQFAADALDYKGPYGEFNVLENIWNARVTSHVPLAKVSSLLSVDAILRALTLTNDSLRDAGVASPRIAVAALNPHAGDGGNFGREEIDIIEPAVAAAKARQIRADGPFPSDTVFLRARNGAYDAVLTMYHDQGQIAIKLMGFDRGVTVLGGLPVPICTPAHGTAYDIAGTGKANVEATRRAFLLACKMGEARARAA